MNEPTFRIIPVFGRMELEQRYIMDGTHVICESRSRSYDGDGRLESVTPWQAVGRCGFDEPTGWFKERKRAKLIEELKRFFFRASLS